MTGTHTMYGFRDSISQYRQVHQAAGDNPHRVIALLLAGFLERIHRAEACLARGDVAGKAAALQNCLEIVDGLRLSLDHEAGGELAANLDGLYEYVSFRLVEANAGNDVARLREVAGLIGKIESAWTAIAGEVAGLDPAGGDRA